MKMSLQNLEKTSDNILLIDSTVTENDLQNLKKTFKKIITFDIESDRKLIMKKIPHDVSDSLIDKSELKLIDSSCINLCQWYNENNGDKLLSYENINIGSLYRIEFYNFLIPILKKFLTIKKLDTIYPNSTFLCSSELSKICTELGINSSPFSTKSLDIELTWDKIQLNLTRSISLNLSKKNYNKIKDLSKLVGNLVVKTHSDSSLKNNFGFIEFDPIKYEKFFLESNNFKGNLHLYNRHRPIIHNMKSLKIIKKSKIIPFVSSKNSSKTTKLSIENSQKLLLENFHSFISNDKSLREFFKFDDIELWFFLKPYLIKIFENKLLDSLNEIEHAKNFLHNTKLKSVIILSECGFTEQIIIKLAKKLSIKIILLQHGIIIESPDAEKYNSIIAGVLPINSDYFFNWGKISSNYMIKQLFLKKIKTIGSPSLDNLLPNKSQKLTNSKNILILATGPRNHQSVGHHVQMWNYYESIIKSIYDAVSKNNLNLIIKRHPDLAETDFSPELYSYLKHAKIIKNESLSNLLTNSKIVISLGISSGVLESQIIDNPVITIPVDYDVFGTTEYILNSCQEIKIEDFSTTLNHLLKNPNSLNNLVRQGHESLMKNIDNLGFSSRILFETLEKL
ncbi:MAG: hypothetical protein CL758_03580 [Chloroflexi bacterium]|nr:hypothetical protein [Chloroflexota bacterium]|tara:strand:+ start:55 stop:1920 length:1866 start_codon:yes stop_codon:yes gene_type:complete